MSLDTNVYRIATVAAGAMILVSGCSQGIRTLPAPAHASGEAATARYVESIRNNPPALTMFLEQMPKGGDLHNHLFGAIYAESFIKWASEDGLCLTVPTLSISQPPCTASENEIKASDVTHDQTLYDRVIDAWSVRNWNPARKNGHDQFFETFDKFDAAGNGHLGDALAELESRAANENISYLELMLGPDRAREFALAAHLTNTTDFGAMRERLLAAGLRDSLIVSRRELDAAEAKARRLMSCSTASPNRGCGVTTRFLYQVLRGVDSQIVFAQILTGFEMSRLDSRWVGLNLVMPEDGLVSMRDFRLHMAMISFLHKLYPEVKITLHAGELAEGLVPPEGMRFHIRESITNGHASRIGHGTDIAHEDSAENLLREMAARHILVEISLSSSDVILGVNGARHPIRTYLAYGVPVALATDDEGVSRSTLTTEFRRAVLDQGLDYRTLKRMVRNSITYSFAEDSVRSRLSREVDSAFARFEAVAY
jgi:adenosine deaminase